MGSYKLIIEEKLLIHMEFIEVSPFQRSWKALNCSDEDLRRLQNELLEDPNAGPVISGTGSARKMRFAREGKGKSGDLRVIYVRFPAYNSVALILAYEKKDQENLTEADKKAIKELIDEVESVLPLQVGGKSKAMLQNMIGGLKHSVSKSKPKGTDPKTKAKPKAVATKAKAKPKASEAKAKTKKVEKKR